MRALRDNLLTIRASFTLRDQQDLLPALRQWPVENEIIARGFNSSGANRRLLCCENYTALVSLREEIGPIELLDARSCDPRVVALWKQGYDLNAGMVFVHDGHIHHGHEATRKLALLSSSSTLFGRLNRRALSHPLMARMTYPLLKLGRLASLKIRKKDLLKDPRSDT